MSGSPVCLVCNGHNDRDTLNCISCWKKHGGGALVTELNGKSKASLKMSFTSTMKLLQKGGNVPRPETRLKLCYIATILVKDHGDWQHRKTLVAAYHDTWAKNSPATTRPAAAAKKTRPAGSAGQPAQPARRLFSNVHEELEAICAGAHQVANGYTGDTGSKPGSIHTDSGHWVASKEEQRLADWLYRNRIAFSYEVPINLESGGVLYPDFVIPRDEQRGVHSPLVIEHFGMLDKPSYAGKAVLRMSALKEFCDKKGWRLAFTSPATIKDHASTVAFFAQYVSGVQGQTPHD